MATDPDAPNGGGFYLVKGISPANLASTLGLIGAVFWWGSDLSGRLDDAERRLIQQEAKLEVVRDRAGNDRTDLRVLSANVEMLTERLRELIDRMEAGQPNPFPPWGAQPPASHGGGP